MKTLVPVSLIAQFFKHPVKEFLQYFNSEKFDFVNKYKTRIAIIYLKFLRIFVFIYLRINKSFFNFEIFSFHFSHSTIFKPLSNWVSEILKNWKISHNIVYCNVFLCKFWCWMIFGQVIPTCCIKICSLFYLIFDVL